MSSTGYPTTLPVNKKVFNTIYPHRLNANFDIVWSFDFNLSGISNATEGGIATFLLPAGTILSGGNVGIDLGYSGLSAGSTMQTNISCGINNAVLGVGFDTRSFFALSASVNDITTRDGYSVDQIASFNRGGICVRGKSPTYNIIGGPISLPNNLQVLNNDGSYISIRCRLGNLGRSLYIDCKRAIDPYYINTLTVDTNLNAYLSGDVFYNVGISFSSPLSSNDENTTAVLRVKNFHVEGRTDSPSESNQTFPEEIIKTLFTLVTEMCATTGGVVSGDTFHTYTDTGSGGGNYPLTGILFENEANTIDDYLFFVNI